MLVNASSQQAAEDAAYLALKNEKAKGDAADPEKLAALDLADDPTATPAAKRVIVDLAEQVETLRAALGEDTISYFGFSYGSELGATWATLFGAVSRMRSVPATETFSTRMVRWGVGLATNAAAARDLSRYSISANTTTG